MNFAAITQSRQETIQEYLIRLKSSAPDCEFSCPGCYLDLQPNHIRDQLIREPHNTLQTDILTKASQLKTLVGVIKHAEAFEAALRDQQMLQGSSEVMAARSSYKNHQQQHQWKIQQGHRSSTSKPCLGCGSQTHGQADRQTYRPAWDVACHNCSRLHHFSRVCRQPKQSSDLKRNESAHGLIAHIKHQTSTRTELIKMALSPCLPKHQKPGSTIHQHALPDSGARICLAHFQHISQMNLLSSELIPCSKKVTAVGGSTINCTRWLPVEFSINGNSSKRPVFVCDKVNRIYVGRQACIDLHILPPCYPHPMTPTPRVDEVHKIEQKLPERSSCHPFPATNDNITNLNKHLIETFKNTVFNKSGAFPAMETIPAHIHLKEEVIPLAHHVPIPVPYDWKEQVKVDLDSDVERGIIQPVPIETLVSWCSKMIVMPKKNGKP